MADSSSPAAKRRKLMRQDSDAKLSAMASPESKHQLKLSGAPASSSGGPAAARSGGAAASSAAVVNAVPTPAKGGGSSSASSGPKMKPSKFWTADMVESSSSSGPSAAGFQTTLAEQIPTSLAAVSRDRKGKNAFFETLKFYYNTKEGYHVFPSWLEPDNIRDAAGRRPDDPDYDQSTLWLPRKPNGQLDEDKMKADPNCPIKKNKETGEVERDKKTKEPLRDTGKFVSPMLIQYWNIKAKNFDKIAL